MSARKSRAQRAELPRFVDNGDGTVTDNTTGLMWTKDNVGSGEMDHEAAANACRALELGGHKDWRLPTRAELLTLVDDTRYNPAIDTTAFPSCKSGWYWIGTTYAGNSSCAWIVDFSYGLAYYGDRDGTAFVRAVRAPRASPFSVCVSNQDHMRTRAGSTGMSRTKKPNLIAEEAARIRSTAAECHALAIFIVESAARKIVEVCCPATWKFGQDEDPWLDITKPDTGDIGLITDCLRYIELRGDALPYRLRRKGKKWVRFEEEEQPQ